MDNLRRIIDDGIAALREYMLQAAEFIGFKGTLPTLVVRNFPVVKMSLFPGTPAYYYPPMIPSYEDNELLISDKWLEDEVSAYHPSLLRCIISYYTYGFKIFTQSGSKINPFPQDEEGRTIAHSIQTLEGVPHIENPIISKEKILDCIKRYKGIDTKFINSISATGHKNIGLAITGESRDKILAEYNSMLGRHAESSIPDYAKGTKENPFEDIDEACEFLKKLEEEAVAKDPFINSEFLNDRFCLGFGAKPFALTRESDFASYEIPWASMFSAHKPNSFPENSFIVTQLTPDSFLKPKFALKPNLYRRKFLYRGQNEEFIDKETKQPICTPNAYRGEAEENPFTSRIKAYHMVSLIEQHPLAQQLGVKGVKIFNEPFTFQLNRLGLTQHYYNKSKFLDLTSDIEVAKFFACGEYVSATDDYKAYENTERLGIIYVYELNMPEAFHPYQTDKGRVHLSNIGKQYVFMRSAMQSGFLLEMPKGLQLHELGNVKRFYFKHKSEKSRKIVSKAQNGKLYFPEDDLSRYWKQLRLADNSEFSITEHTRNLYMQLHPADFKTRGALVKRLKDEKFKLAETKNLEFTPEILQDYYYNIQNGGWEQFCSDIHFHGTEGIFMKRALEQLPLNLAYRSAFYAE